MTSVIIEDLKGKHSINPRDIYRSSRTTADGHPSIDIRFYNGDRLVLEFESELIRDMHLKELK